MRILLLTILAFTLSACSLAKSAPSRGDVDDIKYSGFLGDAYSKLKPTDSEQSDTRAALAWSDPNVNTKLYTKIIIDPIVVTRGTEEGLSGEDKQIFADNFYIILRDELSKDYKIVSQPQSGTMRLQVAITNPEDPNAVLDVLSTVVPIGRAVSEVAETTTGSATSVGKAQVEAKLTDARTGKLISAAVDLRYSQKSIVDMGSTHRTLNQLSEFWAKGLRYNLCKRRGDNSCVKPERSRI